MKKFLRYFCTLLMTMVCFSAWAVEVTDVLNQSLTEVTSTSYTAWTGKTSNSAAVYAGQSAGGNSSIQLRSNNNNSGVVTTTSGGKVKKITVTWHSSTANGRTLNVYGSNTAYSAATDLYNSDQQGTLLGTIVCGTSTELTIADDYEYIGFRSASGAMYLSEVQIVWEDGNQGGGEEPITLIPTVTTIDASGLTNTNFYNGSEAGQLVAVVTNAETSETVDVVVNWSSEYPQVADVDENGVVTLYGTGTTTITAQSLANGIYDRSSATYELTVVYDNPNQITLWSEDFSSYSNNQQPSGGTYAYASEGSGTKVYENDYIAGGVAPELLVAKSGGSFSATVPLEGVEGDLTLTYKTNNTNLTVSTSTEGVEISGDGTSLKGTNTVIITGVTADMTSLTLTFKNSASSNSRLDDILLVGTPATGAKARPNLSFGETTEFTVNVNAEFTAPALTAAEDFDGTVVYASSDENLALVDETTGEVLIGDVAGVVTITASSEETDNFYAGSASYTITIVDPNAPGTENNPYTVAQAIAATPTSGTTADVYIKGVVSAFYANDIVSDGNNCRYYISDDGTTDTQLLVYRGKGLDNVAFSSADDLLIGDEVVICGGLTTYSNAPEVASGNYIVSLNRTETPTIILDAAQLATFAYEAGNGPSDAASVSVKVENAVETSVNVAITTEQEEMPFEFSTDGETFDAQSQYTLTLDTENEAVLYIRLKAGLSASEYTATLTVSAEGAVEKSVVLNGKVSEATQPTPSTGTWVLTNLADIAEGDVFVIVGDNGSTYALSNDNGTSSAPAAVAVTVEDNVLTSEVADNIQWTLSVTEDGYTFYPNGDSEAWLYTTATNNGVRVGTNDNKVFTISEEGYLQNTATNRYVGIYSSQDWRCYTTINNNIKDQTFSFYKKVDSSEEPVTDNVTVTIGAYGLATFASDYALNFEDVESVEAYVAVAQDGTIALQRTYYVPAGTGLLLRAKDITEATEFAIPVLTDVESLPDYSDNLFVRGTGAEVASVDGEYNNYVLSVKNDVVGFYRANNKVVATDKAYLQTSASAAASIFFDFDSTTGIRTFSNATSNNSAMYDLQGRRVNNPQRGIYIVNGKKVVLK